MATLTGVEPRYMGIGPIAAIPKVLAQVGLTKADVDVYEVAVTTISILLSANSSKRSTKLSHRSSLIASKSFKYPSQGSIPSKVVN